jgi:hypothetical protein
MSATVSTSSSLQPLGRLDGVGQVEDGLGIVDIALERGLAQQQVMQHQPGDHFGLLGGQAERGPTSARFGAEFGMVAAAALGDIVQQHADIKRAAGLQMIDQAGGDRRDSASSPRSSGVEHLAPPRSCARRR